MTLAQKRKKIPFSPLTLVDPRAYAPLVRRMPFLIRMPFHVLAAALRQRGRERICNDGVTRKFKSAQLKQQKEIEV
jgi:hypothetical protein